MGKENILVVEDEEDIQELVRYNLAKEGYPVNTVDSGEEGLKQARAKRPDLIILDLMLPGMDGLEVCKLLKNEPKTQHIPIVMLTAKGEESDVVSGLELGADDYITKPFSPKVLIARIRAVLRRRSKESSEKRSTVSLRDRHPPRKPSAGEGQAEPDLHRVQAAAPARAPARLGLYALPDRERWGRT
ncbi:MAG: response regulator [Planctomycetota bacterium]|nr:response regulator [Planctomycetota bacterium]